MKKILTGSLLLLTLLVAGTASTMHTTIKQPRPTRPSADNGLMTIYEQYKLYLDGDTNYIEMIMNALTADEESLMRSWLETYAHGNPEREFRLGNINYYNESKKQKYDSHYIANYAYATKWYQSAALKGLVEAQYELGYCYQHGIGVLKNKDTAFAWYSKAANQGHKKAHIRTQALLKKRKTCDFDNDDETSVHTAKKSRSASQQLLSSLTSHEASSEDQWALSSNPLAAAHEDQARFPFLMLSNESYEASREEIYSPIPQPSEGNKEPMAQSSEDTNVPMTPSSDDDYSLISVVCKKKYNKQPTTDYLLSDLAEETTSAAAAQPTNNTRPVNITRLPCDEDQETITILSDEKANAAPTEQKTNTAPPQEIPIFAEPEEQVV